jgi:hypothetical protein
MKRYLKFAHHDLNPVKKLNREKQPSSIKRNVNLEKFIASEKQRMHEIRNIN